MGLTCNDCRWKVEQKKCPWNYLFDEPDVDYAYDCVDFRNIHDEETKFKEESPKGTIVTYEDLIRREDHYLPGEYGGCDIAHYLSLAARLDGAEKAKEMADNIIKRAFGPCTCCPGHVVKDTTRCSFWRPEEIRRMLDKIINRMSK